MFNIESSLWETKSDYPFCNLLINDYSTVSIQDFVFIIGGKCWNTEDKGDVHSIIAKFKNNLWTQAGNLMISRRYHRSIRMNDHFYIVGGRGTL